MVAYTMEFILTLVSIIEIRREGEGQQLKQIKQLQVSVAC